MTETIPAEVLNALAERRGTAARTLYWITGRDRATGEPAAMGLWNGDDAQAFMVGAETRTYHGPALVEGGRIVTGIGLTVPQIDLTLASLDPGVQQALRGYDARGAAVEIHSVLFALDTRALIAPPRLEWSGHLDTLGFERGAVDEAGIATESARVTMVPQVDRLTEVLPAYRSHEDQQRVAPGDTFFAYAATAALAEVVVGETKVRGGGMSLTNPDPRFVLPPGGTILPPGGMG